MLFRNAMIATSLALFAVTLSARGDGNAGKHVRPAMKAAGLDGKTHVLPLRDTRATLLIFVLHDCPVCNRYAPEVKRIESDYRSKGVDTYVVYEERDLTPAQAIAHAKSYGLTCGLLYDPAHKLARDAGAASTPEAVVLSPDRRVVYHGRIDDRFQHFGMANPAPSRRDLRAALDSFLAGNSVEVTETPVVGCAISKD